MKALLCAGLLLSLVACGETRTKDYYLDHPDEIKTDLAECQKAGENTYNCNQATLAQFQLKNSPTSAHP